MGRIFMYASLLSRWLEGLCGPAFSVRFWDGKVKTYGQGTPTVTLTIKKASVLPEVMRNLTLGFGEAYMRGDIDIEGSITDVVALFHGTTLKQTSMSFGARVANRLLRMAHRGRIGQAQKNVEHHYDLGNDFYALWLDRERLYSCAYFKSPDDTINQAQQNKLNHICKKLFLQPGDTLLDIGCGWGGLVVHAVKHFGVNAHGITLSAGQYEYAKQRVEREGLNDQITIERTDYRELVKRGLSFDKVVSVGMFEHVGQKHISEYMAGTAALLKEGGVGLLHTIGKMKGLPMEPWIEKYIFPGAYLPGIGEMLEAMKEFPLRVIDVENLRRHYALTLDWWLKGFEANLEKIRGMYGDSFIRMWRLYLAGSSAGFRYGDLELWQIQFTKGLRNDLPMTRDYLS